MTCSNNNTEKMDINTKISESDAENEKVIEEHATKRNKLSKKSEAAAGTAQQKSLKQTDISNKEKSASSTSGSPSTQLNKMKSMSLRIHKGINEINKKNGDTMERSDGITTTSNKNSPENLLIVISNLYLNVRERLHLDLTPRCLDDLAYCRLNHYQSELPAAPNRAKAQALRTCLENNRYASAINVARDMCFRCEFPGAGIFKKLIELVLSINYNVRRSEEYPNGINNTSCQCLRKCISLFSTVVRIFPPCWHKMRPYYSDFLESDLDLNKISLTNEDDLRIIKSTKIFDILLDLLEDLFKNYKMDELCNIPDSFIDPTLQRSMQNDCSSNNDNDISDKSMDSIFSTCWNQFQYEEQHKQKQTYIALKPSQRLERIFISLRLLLQILEHDLSMWILHHNRNTKAWIFTDSSPLIVVLCKFTKFTRMTRVARRIFTVFSEGVAKGLHKTRLEVLERYISLIMEASNTIDTEHTPIGVEYPVLSNQTKTLITDFFEIFKEHNRENISKYIENIELLRTPFVRYEFINNILFTNTKPITPEKIYCDMAKKRWQNYKIRAELKQPNNEISREEYLYLLLHSLRSYSDWHGLKMYWQVVTNTITTQPLTTTTDSIHHYPCQDGNNLNLKKLVGDIHSLQRKLRVKARMSKQRVNLSLADISINEKLMRKYQQDLKYVFNLNSVLLKHKNIYNEVDFNNWLGFLKDFSVT